jgi:hypothetical protein
MMQCVTHEHGATTHVVNGWMPGTRCACGGVTIERCNTPGLVRFVYDATKMGGLVTVMMVDNDKVTAYRDWTRPIEIDYLRYPVM